MIDIGVASPRAHGQAMIRTETAAIRPWARRGSGPQIAHAVNADRAMAMTIGTNHPETLSAMRWIGARDRCASATIWTIRASMVSRPTFSARMMSAPVWFNVPPVTAWPAVRVTGMDSPVTMDSSIDERPSSTTPSTGTVSPGRILSLSPMATASIGTSSSRPSRPILRAVFGARSSKARIAPEVFSRARNSNTWPSSTRTVMTAAASK